MKTNKQFQTAGICFTIIFLLLSCASNNAQINLIRNYPLHTGNVFVFKHIVFNTPPEQADTSFIRCTILNDSLINGFRYYYFDRLPFSGGYYGFDSTNGKLFSLPGCLVDSLWSNSQNYYRSCYFSNTQTKCVDTHSVLLWGSYRFSRSFNYGWGFAGMYGGRDSEYANGFGLIYFRTYSGSTVSYSSSSYTLKGCLINGILYGDTVNYYIGIKGEITQIPKDFSLFQNYPNPFNPKTKINYDIPKNSYVKLIVYDILGTEVVRLVNNELKQPGRYTVEFNGTNFASGVYFFSLEARQEGFPAGDYVMVRKMVLVK